MSGAALELRRATPSDAAFLRRAVVDLQDYERTLHDTRLPGETMADSYVAWLQARATDAGVILVALVGGELAGFAAGWVECDESLAETPDSNRYGLVSDIFVLPAFRGRRIAAKLIEGLEALFVAEGVSRLRVTALAANASARRGYDAAGFSPYEVTYEKRLSAITRR